MASTVNEQDALRKKARKKYLANALSSLLVRVPNSPLNKSYAKSFACCHTLVIDRDSQLKSNYYCRARWCKTCASIRTATMINKYLPTFAQFNDLYFVTLTARTVKAEYIASRLNQMQSSWRKICDLARKKQVGFKGLRKTELKVSKGSDYLYHPHYHIMVEGKENALFIIENWLRINGEICGVKAQHLVKVDMEKLEKSLLEMFKYSTKITCADKGDNEILATPRQMDIIFRSLYGKRIYQSFGGLRAIDEESFEVNAETFQKAQGIYEWVGCDWWHTDFGQCLTGWTPTPDDMALNHFYTDD